MRTCQLEGNKKKNFKKRGTENQACKLEGNKKGKPANNWGSEQ
jgi:hypothetical protein